VNARVSVQGVYGPVFTESGVRTGSVILTPSPTFVKIVSVPRAAETRSIASITQFDLRGFPGHRVRIPGSVTYRDDEGVAYLQDGDNALRIVRATAGEPSLHARAVVEGFIAPDTAVPQLEEAHWVSQAPDSPVAPVRALAETLATGDLEGRLVEVEGFLESRRTTGGRLQLNLQTGRTRYTASLAAPASANGFPALRPGALVRLSGICVNRASGEANGGRSASLLLRTPDDLVVVQAAPWWDLRRSLYAAFAASALLVMALGWVVFLRVHLLRQVSLRAKLEDRLRHAQKLESLGRLAGGVAHDFNNYLTVIMGYSSQVLDRLHPRDPNREALATIHDVSSQAAGLTRQLLAFGRRQVLQPVHCDLDELLNQARKTLLPLIGETVELVVRQGGNLDPVRIDPVQFMEVLVNLAVNARDAMPAGGRLIYQTANVELYDEDVRHRAGLHVGRYVRLTVTDTGTGMDAETRKRIFEPFFTTKQQGRGTGLGLAVVFGIVEQSGGHIEVESEPGQGSTFRAYLPVADGKPEPRVAEAAPPAVLLRGQETVLVVEDQDGVRALVSAVLKARGLRVVAAADPAQTLEIMESMAEPAQLLLTDMRMPGMSGQALSELVKAKWPGIRVLYMSGYSEEAARDHAGPAGCFIQKPFSPAQLAEAVERMLAEIV
jgi:signal transduction histidine kinase/CheY-like chemotaxis protein